MRILAIAAAVPYGKHDRPGITAVNIVVNELIREIARAGNEVVFQLLGNVHRGPTLSDEESAALEDLRADGIEALPPLLKEAYLRPRSQSPFWWARRRAGVVAGRFVLSETYPAIRLAAEMRKRIRTARADVVLTIWSPEGVAATHGLSEVPRIAYQGDVDFEPGLARYRDVALFGDKGNARSRARDPISRRLAIWRDALWQREFRQAHYALMGAVASIANVTAINAEHYARRGHPRSFYARNVWRAPTANPLVPPAGAGGTIAVVGHAGRLDSTTSTYGLRYLLTEVLPELERALADVDWRLEIIGGGTLPPVLAERARQPRVVLRGFVPDLDAELRATPAFLMLNNVAPFKAAHTRHLVAWSLRACLVVHRDSTLAIPEIQHRVNALVGGTAKEIADLVRLAVMDRELNARIRNAGHETFLRWFTPPAVAGGLMREMDALVRQGPRAISR